MLVVEKSFVVPDTIRNLVRHNPVQKNSRTPSGYWNSVSNQRSFLDSLGKSLNITSHEEWYKVTIAKVYEHGGASLLTYRYGNSVRKLLTTVYPEYHLKI